MDGAKSILFSLVKEKYADLWAKEAALTGSRSDQAAMGSSSSLRTRRNAAVAGVVGGVGPRIRA